jgi:hypothetical protein
VNTASPLREARPAIHADLTPEDVERLYYLLGALRASLMLCEDGDVGAFTSDLRSAFFANLATIATSAHAIVSHISVNGGSHD